MKKFAVVLASVLAAVVGAKLVATPITNIMSLIGEDPKDCTSLTGQAFCDCFRQESESQCQKFMPARDCVPMQAMFDFEAKTEGSIENACRTGCKMEHTSEGLELCTSQCVDESARYKDNTKGDNCPLDKGI